MSPGKRPRSRRRVRTGRHRRRIVSRRARRRTMAALKPLATLIQVALALLHLWRD